MTPRAEAVVEEPVELRLGQAVRFQGDVRYVGTYETRESESLNGHLLHSGVSTWYVLLDPVDAGFGGWEPDVVDKES